MDKILEKFSTPFYVFDIDVLHKRLDYLHSKLGSLNLCYAVKANPFIIHEVLQKVSRLEICSEGEYDICEKLGVPSDVMVISGVYKTPEFIEKLICNDSKCIYTLESFNQFELIKELAKKYTKNVKIMPRLTSGNQFGVNEEEIIKIVSESKNSKNLKIVGLEYFSGTQKYSLKKTEREFECVKELFERVKNECDFEFKELEYGSGFPVEYFNENKLDEEEFFNEFTSLMNNYFGKLKITIEIGRSIAASCGKYFTKVVDMKENNVGNFAIVDGGMNHLVYYGQTMAMKFPNMEILPKRSDKNVKNWNICGALCTINDIIVKQLPLSDLKVGDCLVFNNTGAYSMCEGISLFLSRDLPKIIIKKGDNLSVVRDTFKTSNLNTPNI